VSQRAALTSIALACALAIGPACGGGGAGGAPAKSGKAAGAPSVGSEGEDGPGGDDGATGSVSRCADGTCFECGSGLCPKGFYCDEKAPGGPACGWLPECAAVATCACVEQVLGADCSCTEKGVGPSVSCQGR
jgi:hypothetical protein